MKKALLLLVFATVSLYAQAQTCVRDSSLIGTQQIISPPPSSPTAPEIVTPPACINEPYAMSATLNVPDTFSVPGLGITAPLDSVVLTATGAVTGLPIGLGYTCDPPNCHFKKNTLGCILIAGTPTAVNTPDTFELSITLKVYSPFLPFPIDLAFPGTVAPDNHYYLIVKPTGQCASSSVNELAGQISTVKSAPNPFSNHTDIIVESLVNGAFQFEVFDMLGSRVHSQNIRLNEGTNQFTFDAGDIPAGTYIYTIGNAEGKVVRKMVKMQ